MQENLRRNSHGNATLNSEENSSLVSMGQGEKRTRFSLSHDEGSIGNTSDNLEAISEAASNHSVASSLEDEPDNPDAEDPIIDNLSDMYDFSIFFLPFSISILCVYISRISRIFFKGCQPMSVDEARLT